MLYETKEMFLNEFPVLLVEVFRNFFPQLRGAQCIESISAYNLTAGNSLIVVDFTDKFIAKFLRVYGDGLLVAKSLIVTTSYSCYAHVNVLEINLLKKLL